MTSIDNNAIGLGRDVDMAIGLESQWAIFPERFSGLIVSRETLNSQQQWHRPPQLGSGLHAQPSRLVQASIGGDMHLAPTSAVIKILIMAIADGTIAELTETSAISSHLQGLSIELAPDLQSKFHHLANVEIGNQQSSFCIIRRLNGDADWKSFMGLVPRQIRLGAAEGRQFVVSANVIGKQATPLAGKMPEITQANSKQILGFDHPQSYHKFRIITAGSAAGETGLMITSWQLDISRTGTRPIFDLSGTAPRAIANGLLAASGQIRFVIGGAAPASWALIGNTFAFQIAAFAVRDEILIIDLPICHITSSRIITQTADDVVTQEVGFELRRGNETPLFRFLFGDVHADN